MQAIVTKYICATNIRGTRISARCAGGRVIVGYDDALNNDANHAAAATKLAAKLGWDVRLVMGTLPNGDRVFVIDDRN